MKKWKLGDKVRFTNILTNTEHIGEIVEIDKPIDKGLALVYAKGMDGIYGIHSEHGKFPTNEYWWCGMHELQEV